MYASVLSNVLNQIVPVVTPDARCLYSNRSLLFFSRFRVDKRNEIKLNIPYKNTQVVISDVNNTPEFNTKWLNHFKFENVKHLVWLSPPQELYVDRWLFSKGIKCYARKDLREHFTSKTTLLDDNLHTVKMFWPSMLKHLDNTSLVENNDLLKEFSLEKRLIRITFNNRLVLEEVKKDLSKIDLHIGGKDNVAVVFWNSIQLIKALSFFDSSIKVQYVKSYTE